MPQNKLFNQILLTKTISSRTCLLFLQDILREKQNHIEQLMQERDLEKQDAGNQILTYQTNISQVCIFPNGKTGKPLSQKHIYFYLFH